MKWNYSSVQLTDTDILPVNDWPHFNIYLSDLPFVSLLAKTFIVQLVILFLSKHLLFSLYFHFYLCYILTIQNSRRAALLYLALMPDDGPCDRGHTDLSLNSR